MTIPKYKRPAVPLVYALQGHPKFGNVWEEHADSILAKLGWRKVADWTGVFVQADMSIICLYVDDFMMVATDELEKRHWAEIGKHIEFKEDAALLARYLGANYNIDKFSMKEPNRARQIRVSLPPPLACACGAFSGRPSGRKAVSSDVSFFCRRRSGPMPMTSRECTRLSVRATSRVLSLHLWLAGRISRLRCEG